MSIADAKIEFSEALVPDEVRQQGEHAVKVYRMLADVVCEVGSIEPEDLTMGSLFGDDLKFDSLDFTELVMEIGDEKSFEVEVSDKEIEKLPTGKIAVGHVFKLLLEKVPAT